MKSYRFFPAFIFTFFVLCQSFAMEQRACWQLVSGLPIVSKALESNRFVTIRDLQEYYHGLHENFKIALWSLKSNQTWIDYGGGKGYALVDYLKSNDRPEDAANTVLITYKLGRLFGISNYNGKLKVLKNRLFEDIPIEEIPMAHLGTDFFGVLSYTRDFSGSLQKMLDRLVVNGELYTHLSNSFTSIVTDHGHVNITTFLAAIPGIEVEGQWGILRIKKTSAEVKVPKLELIKVDEQTLPPFRQFRKID